MDHEQLYRSLLRGDEDGWYEEPRKRQRLRTPADDKVPIVEKLLPRFESIEEL